MYVILEFEENICEMAPKTWLQGSSMCLWPPKKVKGYEVATYIRRQKAPEPGWQLLAVKILGQAATFQEAKRKTRKATFESELSTDADCYGRGKRRRKSVVPLESCESESDDSTIYSSQIMSLKASLPVPPGLQADTDIHEQASSSLLSNEVNMDFSFRNERSTNLTEDAEVLPVRS